MSNFQMSPTTTPSSRSLTRCPPSAEKVLQAKKAALRALSGRGKTSISQRNVPGAKAVLDRTGQLNARAHCGMLITDKRTKQASLIDGRAVHGISASFGRRKVYPADENISNAAHWILRSITWTSSGAEHCSLQTKTTMLTI